MNILQQIRILLLSVASCTKKPKGFDRMDRVRGICWKEEEVNRIN